MKKYGISLIVLIFCLATLHAADKYTVGDTLYVWAKNGLNVRSDAGTKHQKVSKLSFGQWVVVIEKTTVPYNVKALSEDSPHEPTVSADPVIWKGEWVKVRTPDGIVGYTIDQYFLAVAPAAKTDNWSNCHLEIIKRDTLDERVDQSDDIWVEPVVQLTYQKEITSVTYYGEGCGETHYFIPNLSMEEVMVMFGATLDNYLNYTVYKNWKEEIRFSDNDLCDYTVRVKEGGVAFVISCCC